MSLLSSDARREVARPPLGGNVDLFLRCYALMATLSCAVGTALLTGGAARFSGPGFSGPYYLVSWLPFVAPWAFWGVMFVAKGALSALLMRRPGAVLVLRAGVVLHTFFAIAFAWSVLVEPTAAALGSIVFLGFAAVNLFLQDHLTEFGWGR